MLKSYTLEGDEARHNAAEERTVVRKKVHRFYFVKLRPYEDSQMKAKIEEIEELISIIDQKKSQISEKISEKQKQLVSRATFETVDKAYMFQFGNCNREFLKSLQLALDKLTFANRAYQGNLQICFFLMMKLQFRMRHKTKDAAEERQIFREIKSSQREARKKAEIPYFSQLELLLRRRNDLRRSFFCDRTLAEARDREIEELELAITVEREREITFAAVKGKIWNSLGSKADLKDTLKIVSTELDELRPEELELMAEIKRVEEELNPEAMEKDVHKLKQKLKDVDKRKDKLLEYILKLRSDDQKASYGQYVSLLESAREWAKNKDIEALAELYHKEVETFMSQWNTSKPFRQAYMKRVS